MADISIIILTFNEEVHLERALRSVQSFAKKVYVVDSYSKDRTLDIARQYGAEIVQHPFENYAKQLQWAIETLPISTAWVMRLDADEWVEADLANELNQRLADLPQDVTGIVLKLKQIFLDRWIRRGAQYPLKLLRIWRRGVGRIENRWMDEHMVLSHGRTTLFSGNMANHQLKDLTFFTQKHNHYATREALDILNQRYHLGFSEDRDTISSGQTSSQAAIKRWIKIHIYNRLPFWFGPTLYFFYRMFLRGGIFDGPEGIIYHVLQGFWYRFLVGAKVFELERSIAGLTTPEAIRAKLAAETGFKL